MRGIKKYANAKTSILTIYYTHTQQTTPPPALICFVSVSLPLLSFTDQQGACYSPKELRIRIEIFYVGIVQDTFLSKDTSHSFLYGKACVFMDKMGEHTATPERAIELQKIGGPLADMCS